MPRSIFAQRLRDLAVDVGRRRWVFVPYDQLSDRIGLLAGHDPAELGIVVVECPQKAARRPYHRQKLLFVLANLRHFALEQASRGVAVRHVVSPGDYADALRPVARELGGVSCMRPAERELRAELAPLRAEGLLDYAPHGGWLTTTAQFESAHPKGPPFRMDAFYRRVRQDTGILMGHDGRPEGGRYSFDGDNRKPWKGDPTAPELPRFEPDAVTLEVLELVERDYADHPGLVDPTALPTTLLDAEECWGWALDRCLDAFGPYQDAMSRHSASLFHTRISPLLHVHRLLPSRVVEDALAADAPLASREGFVRQVLGWREYVRHVHAATDGFRVLPAKDRPQDSVDVDAPRPSPPAAPSHLGANGALPAAFWGSPSGLGCLDSVVADVWQQGYGHHITRLMVLANAATLLDVSPRALTDWFWCAYLDAYDWVVEPNVLGMGTYALGELLTTKPYVSGAAYIDRMGDYCRDCAFDPKRNCPFRSLYWDFLRRHEEQLAGNRRLDIPLAARRKRSDAQQHQDRLVFEAVRRALEAGKTLTPDSIARSTGGATTVPGGRGRGGPSARA